MRSTVAQKSLESLRQIHIERLKQQIENYNLLLAWATGTGKSKAAIDVTNEYIRKKNKECKILLLVAETAHKKNWLDELSKWKASFNPVIECYASLKNYTKTQWDIIILDECHHIISDLRSDILSTIKASRIIGLSATVNHNVYDIISDIYGRTTIDTIKLQTAFDSKIIAEPEINLIEIELDNNDRDLIYEIKRGKGTKIIECDFKDRFQYMKKSDVLIKVKCTEREYYTILNDNFNFYKDRYRATRQPFLKQAWLRSGSTRKAFLGERKTRYVYSLLQDLRKNKTKFICFHSSILQAEALGGNNCIHSKKKGTLSIIDKFNQGEIRELHAIGMCTEGQNLEGIEAGVIVQLDNKDRLFVQKFGRTLRSKNPIEYIFIYKNTCDEDYLKNVYETVDKKFIKITTLNK